MGSTNIADAVTTVNPNTAQGPGPGPIGPGPGCNLFPAPPSVGTTVNLSYFGPPPSTTNQSLVGPVQLLKSGPIDVSKGTVTIPLYLGHMKNGANVWYVLTDEGDRDVTDQEKQKAEELISRLELSVGQMFPRDGGNAALIASMIQSLNGLRSLLGLVRPH